MFDKFTENAKQAVIGGQHEAEAFGHDFIGADHLMLGLLTAPGGAAEVLRAAGIELDSARAEVLRGYDARGVAREGGRETVEALAGLGIDVDAVRRRAEERFGEGSFQFPTPAFEEDAKRLLRQAVHEAVELEHQSIDTEHLLLGLSQCATGPVCGVEPARLREAAMARLS